jgi:O-antigen ligase
MDNGKPKQSGQKLGVSNSLILVFLLFNLVIRFGSIFNYPPYNGVIAGFLGVVVSACVFVVCRPKYLKHLLFIFGFSFFLFGFGSIDIQSRIFELIVTLVAMTLFVVNWRAGRGRGRIRTPVEYAPLSQVPQLNRRNREVERDKNSTGQGGRRAEKAEGEKIRRSPGLNRPLVILLLCYVGLSLFSLLLLPVRQIVRDLWFFGFPDCFFYLFIGPPHGFYYPVSAVIRLILFVVLAVQISITTEAQDNYRWLFSAIFSGAVFCAFIGLLDFYGVVPLAWYRFGGTTTPGVLHSTFGNRGWFGEFILISVPFLLIGFMSRIKAVWWKVLLFGSLVICEIALLLAGGRSGWVSYPVILFVCWLFFWFSKEGRLESFHFRWKDLVKVAVSVPITIVISLVIVFYLFIPLSDHLKSSRGGGIQEGGGATKARIVNQTARLVEPSGRLKAWTQGIDVARESPLFGLGYESFSWHAHILAGLPNSYYTIYKENKHHQVLQTPHNIFLQIFVSGGAVGICLWLFIVGYALVILTFDLIKEKRLLNTPVIICILSFHIFGIFQSMQYIPMIWSMIFLCLGYAMTIDDGVLPGRLRRVFGVLTKASVVLVAIGFFVYLGNFESKSLAKKYGLRIYAMDQDQDRFAGFYQHSQRWKYGDYRWCGKRGAIYVQGGPSEIRSAVSGVPQLNRRIREVERGKNFTGQGAGVGGRRSVELEFYCRTPGMEKEPVEVKVSHEGEVVDRITFGGHPSETLSGTPPELFHGAGKTEDGRQKAKGGKGTGYTVRRRYELKGERGAGSGEERLVVEVSRTWIPHNHLVNFDRRELGVGVRIVKTDPS